MNLLCHLLSFLNILEFNMIQDLIDLHISTLVLQELVGLVFIVLGKLLPKFLNMDMLTFW
jgi:hypothetical protein